MEEVVCVRSNPCHQRKNILYIVSQMFFSRKVVTPGECQDIGFSLGRRREKKERKTLHSQGKNVKSTVLQ